ncbi:MAG: amidohydrolase family protein, partial [Bdellovibrionales bacterium]|nr:amidohydrolase family protein [Bdellovibrionales bacterium]
MSSFPRLLTGGTIVTQNKNRDVFVGDILIQKNKIVKIAKEITPPHNADIIDAKNQFVIPGLIQAHTHLCQALFRGHADDLPLLDWLKNKIWPFEKNHNENSIQASARIGLYEMQRLGTTTILDMATVQHTDSLFEEVIRSKIRYFGGKCLMDFKKYSGPLYEDIDTTLKDLESQISKWHQKNDLIDYVISPRFAISCTDSLLKECSALQKTHDLLIHTHASESKDEVALIKKRTGYNNIDYLAHLGLLNSKTIIVHGVHVTRTELKKMIQANAKLVH